MQIDASAIMWGFGLCFVSLTGLLGVVWAMLNKRLNTIEDQAEKDRTEFRMTTSKLFDELKSDREASADSDKQILAAVNSIGKSCGDRRADCVDKFVKRTEFDNGLNTIRSEMKKGA